MNFTLQPWDLLANKCSFYTVIIEGQEIDETEKFFLKYERQTKDLLHFIIDVIGKKEGAKEAFFRFENNAHALPPKPNKNNPDVAIFGLNFGYRLYCYRISDSILVLFNGGKKDTATAQQSKDLSMKFAEAQIFAKKIQEAINNGTILIAKNNRTLTDFQSNNEIFL